MRALLDWARSQGILHEFFHEAMPRLEIAARLRHLNEAPTLFQEVRGSPFRVAAGVCSERTYFARALGVPVSGVIHKLAGALENPQTPPILTAAPCQEVVERQVDVHRLPMLWHFPEDPGPFATAAVAIIRDPDYGQNASYHRLMPLGPNRLVARIVEQRGTDSALHKVPGDLDVAICIGNSVSVLLAASLAPPPGVDELHIAHALAPTPLVRCVTKDLYVPADCEIVLEGRITRELADEGPFVDLTETRDFMRRQPVIEVDCLTHRRDAIYQALLPGGKEHKLLMGMPKEANIYTEVARVCRVRNVLLTMGGCSWLHAVVQIHKTGPDDPRKAIEASFRAHGSLKHCLVVDDDIDIANPEEIEWAIATRVQADRDLIILPDRPSSSLDPSACHTPGQKSRGCKLAIDATVPWTDPEGRPLNEEERKAFARVQYHREKGTRPPP